MKLLFSFFGLFFVLCITNFANATHAAGGEIFYEHIGGPQYKVSLLLYLDCGGASAPPSAPQLAISGCGDSDVLVLSYESSTVPDQLCDMSLSSCAGGNYPGYESRVYSGVYILPFPCAEWKFSYQLCCRNQALTTLDQPELQDLYLEATLNNLGWSENDSPRFGFPPVFHVCNGNMQCIPMGASDIDGDSLVFELIPPRVDSLTTVTYLSGYSVTNPMIVSSGVTIDPLSGDICFTPNGIQVGVIAVRIRSFDTLTGVELGSVIRDLQVSVVGGCSGQAPVLNGFDGMPLQPGVNDVLQVCAYNSSNVTLSGTDPDGDIPNFWSSSYPIEDNLDGTFDIQHFFTNSDVGRHTVFVSARDSSCPLPNIAYGAYHFDVLEGSTPLFIIDSLTPGYTAYLTNTSAIGDSLVWNLNGQILGTSDSSFKPSVTYTDTAWVCLTAINLPNGCRSTYCLQIIEDLGFIVDVQEKEPISELKVYPNPASTEIVVSGVGGDSRVLLLDSQGRVVWDGIPQTVQNNRVTIQVSHLKPGMYLVKVHSMGSSQSLKLIIE